MTRLQKEYDRIEVLKKLEDMLIARQDMDADIYDLIVKLINESFKNEM